MAVAEMSKLRLIGLTQDKDRLLNSLQRTGAVQITTSREIEGLKLNNCLSIDEITALKDKIDLALSIIEKAVYDSEDKELKKSLPVDGFAVDSGEFNVILSKSKEIIATCDEIINMNNSVIELKSTLVQLDNEISSYNPYLNVKQKFSVFNSGEKTTVKFGLIASSKQEKFFERINAIPTAESYVVADSGSNVAVAVLYYKNSEEVIEALQEASFTECQFTGEYTASEKVNRLKENSTDVSRQINSIKNKILSYLSCVRDIKILSDRYLFEIEKATENSKFAFSESTFTMEAFVPVKKQEKVTNAIKKTTDVYCLLYDEVSEDDLPPTYTENSKFASNFEFVTNMYSAPKYGALDPNAVMGFFFSLFMGIIVADAGYGLLLLVGGLIYSKKMATTVSMKRLANILAIGGIFAIPFGALFDSFMGYQLIHKICEITSGTNNAYAEFYTANLDAIASFSSLAGISIPTMLLWSLLFGALHLIVGYVLKAVHDFKNKRYVDGFVDGICWAVFLLGLSIFAYTMIEGVSEKILTPLQNIGVALLAIGLGIAVIFAGRKNKGLGKITGSFGSLYGVINILSDILSYARLYGLMLSGSQVASIFTNTIAIDMLFPLGVVGVVFGVIVILIGNVFNLAMGVLGAYIHDSRLQYVEFFGKFYEGDGEVFKPLGSTFSHVTYVADQD